MRKIKRGSGGLKMGVNVATHRPTRLIFLGSAPGGARTLLCDFGPTKWSWTIWTIWSWTIRTLWSWTINEESRGGGTHIIRGDVQVPPSTSDIGSFGDRSKKKKKKKNGGSFGDRSKIMGSFSDIKLTTGYKSLKILSWLQLL